MQGDSPKKPITPTKLQEESIDCYIHGVTGIKRAEHKNRNYFYCTLQTEHKSYRGICFSPEKQSELSTIQKVKSPVKLQRFTLNDDEEILFDKTSKITPLDKDQVKFQPVEFTSSGLVQNISSLEKLATEQLVSLKAQVVSVSGIKIIDTRDGKLKKQETVIRDTTRSINLTLWNDYVDTLEENKTYELYNLRLKTYKNNMYLNTAKSEQFTFKETAPFNQQLVEVEKDVKLSTSQTWLNARVIGLHQSSKELACLVCKKRVIPHEDNVFGDCTGCKMLQVLSNCKSSWFIRMAVQNTEKPSEIARLAFNHQSLEELLQVIDVVLDLQTATDKQILKAIVEKNKTVKITFDSITKRVTDI